MTEPLPDLWASRDFPVLVAVARLLDETGRPVTSYEVASEVQIEQPTAVRALTNLAHGFLEVRSENSVSDNDCYVVGITADGLRAAGQWPSPEAAVDRLIAALDAQIDVAPEGSPKASKLRALRDGVVGVSRDLLVEVMGAVITGRLPT